MKTFVAALLISLPAVTLAGEPVQNIDGLIREIESCLLKDAKTGSCMEKSLGGLATTNWRRWPDRWTNCW